MEVAVASAQATASQTEWLAVERVSAIERNTYARIAAKESASAEGIRQREGAAIAAERVLSARIAELQRTVGALEEQADLQSMGFYRLRYDFASSAEYEARLDQVRERQKAMLKDGTAAVCSVK